jgi:hypothetical protein
MINSRFILIFSCVTSLLTGCSEKEITDVDGDGIEADAGDCNDEDANISPSATDIVGDNIDQNCDGIDGTDADGDGYASVASGGDDCADDDASFMPVDADDDGVNACTDCDDNDASAFPGAIEACDEIDNDCNGLIDDEDPALSMSTTTEFWIDADGDGFGDMESAVWACAQPDNTVENADDCDDMNELVHPDATEVCDEMDNDCDALIDDADDSVDASTGWEYYMDSDGDGYGDDAATVWACDQWDYALEGGDCDDTDAMTNPGAMEVCDEMDNDCDALIDDADDSVDAFTGWEYYADADLDGYGDMDSSMWACEVPSGYVSDWSDCDDTDNMINPMVFEVCDEMDNDCDGLTDDDDDSLDGTTGTSYYYDLDFDGYGDPDMMVSVCEWDLGLSDNGEDCNDGNGAINPMSTDIYGDMIDQNCDGTDGLDMDGDGYASYSSGGDDCDDMDVDLNWDDVDMDGVSTCEDDCDDNDMYTAPGIAWYEVNSYDCMTDMDGDGYGDPNPTVTDAVAGNDCDDSDMYTHPGAAEAEISDPNEEDYMPTYTQDMDLNCIDECSIQFMMDEYEVELSSCDDFIDGFGVENWETGEYCGGCDTDSSVYYCHAESEGFWNENQYWDGMNDYLDNYVPDCMTDWDEDGYGDPNPTVTGAVAGNDCDDSDMYTYPGAAEEEISDPEQPDFEVAFTQDMDMDCIDQCSIQFIMDEYNVELSSCDDFINGFGLENWESGQYCGGCETDSSIYYCHAESEGFWNENQYWEQEEQYNNDWNDYLDDYIYDCMTDADEDGYGDMNPTVTGAVAGMDCDDSDMYTHPGAAENEGPEQPDFEYAFTQDSNMACMMECEIQYMMDEYGFIADDLDGCQQLTGVYGLEQEETGYWCGGCDIDPSVYYCHAEAEEFWNEEQYWEQEEQYNNDWSDFWDSYVPECMTDWDEDGYGDSNPTSTDVVAGTDCDDTEGYTYLMTNTWDDVAEYVATVGWTVNVDAECNNYCTYEGFNSEMGVYPNDVDGDGVLTCADVNIEYDAFGWGGSYCGSCDMDDSVYFCHAGSKGYFDNEQWEVYAETLTPVCRTDEDGDGWMDANPTSSNAIPGMDCDDVDGEVHPYAVEISGDGIDQDCDGND